MDDDFLNVESPEAGGPITSSTPQGEDSVVVSEGDRSLLDSLPTGVSVEFDVHHDQSTELVEVPSADLSELVGDTVEEPLSESTASSKQTRKRQRNTKSWKKNVAKEKLSKGQEHLNPKGKLIRGRALKPGCDESCKLGCSHRFGESDRKAIHQEFWNSYPTKESKWAFLALNVDQTKVMKHTGKEGEHKRKYSRVYSFRVRGEKIRVCKTMFLATLDICDAWVDTSMRKRDSRTGGISPDKRTFHGARKPNEELEKMKETVREHIRSLPRMPAHYTRATSSREYLHDNIQSVADMVTIYEEWMTEKHPEMEKIATYRQYNDIFNNEFNISFFIAKKDQCEDCVQYELASAEEKEKLKPAFDEHCLNMELAQTIRMADTKVAQLKSSTSLCVACFDYQKSLICPKARASVFYYKRKLSVNNFTIVDCGRHEDVCYCYTEVVGGKGSNEVASFLLHYIQEKVAKGITDFRFYSDNCAGQNKNRGVVSMYLYAAAKFGISITHRFLEKGHTWNAADNVHSLIERKVKPHDIYSPDEYYEKIAAAKRKAVPIQVIKVTQNMIYEWKNDLVPKLNLDKNVDGAAIPWTRLRQISVGNSCEHEFKYKVNLNDPGVTVSTKGVGRPVNLKSFEPKKAYNALIPLSKAKYNDLKHYCDHNLIPDDKKEFFRNLPCASQDLPDDDTADQIMEEAPVAGRARKRRVPTKKKSKNKSKTSDAPQDLSDDADNPE